MPLPPKCQQYMMEYKTKIFLLTFLAYMGVHSIRTSYSFSKKLIAGSIQVDDTQLGLVDSLLLYGIALGYLQLAFLPFSRPLLALFIGLLLVALFYILVPLFVTFIAAESFAILCVLMTVDGYFQSWTWPHLLMIINSQYDNKKEGWKLGLWTTCTNFGNILGFVICQAIVLNNDLPWQISMLVVGGYIVLMALLNYCNIDELIIQPPHAAVSSSAGSNNESLITGSRSSADCDHEPQPSNKQNIMKILKEPVVILITIAFSLVKSIEFGILFWLPLYFDIIGLVQYSAYIPITFDSASIVSSVALGYAFGKINNKGLLLAPLILLLVICFALLRFVDASVGLYFVLVAGVGLFLGGSYNTLSSLVTIELVKVVAPQLRTKYLGIYTAVLMCFANLITASFQLIIGIGMRTDQSLIFTIFFWLGIVILILLTIVGILEHLGSKRKGELISERQIEIVGH